MRPGIANGAANGDGGVWRMGTAYGDGGVYWRMGNGALMGITRCCVPEVAPRDERIPDRRGPVLHSRQAIGCNARDVDENAVGVRWYFEGKSGGAEYLGEHVVLGAVE